MKTLTLSRRQALLAGLGSLAPLPSFAQQTFTMKMSTPGVDDTAVDWMKAVKAGAEPRSGGKLKVEVYPANQLGPLPRTVEGVALGTVELAMPSAGFVAGLEPRFLVFDAPGMFDDIQHAMRVIQDPDVRKRLSGYGMSKGIEPLTIFAYSPLTVVTHKPIRTLADLKGMKLRVPGAAPLHIEPMKALGANPISIAPGDILPALQNKTIDGAIGSPLINIPNKFYDVVKYQTFLPGAFLIGVGIANRNFLKSLGADLEKIVREEAQKADGLFSKEGVELNKRADTTWAEKGGENIQFSADDRKRYLQIVSDAADKVTSANEALRDEYKAIIAAAAKHRKA